MADTGLDPILVDDSLLLGMVGTSDIVARVNHAHESVAHVTIHALTVVIRLRLYCRKSDTLGEFGAVVFKARVNFGTTESIP